jgi:uncharacterized protein (DUF1684 family)
MFVVSRYRIALVTTVVATLTAAFIATHAVAIDVAQEQRDIEQWRAARIARLTGPTGWLTLVGLYWFNEGANTFGRAEKNALVLDHKNMPSTLGTFTLSNGKVLFSADSASVVTQAGKPVKSIAMLPDSSDDPTVLDAGSIEFFVIERVGKMGLRVRDTEHPARKNFRGIDYFPISATWALDAKFEPYTPVHHIEIINILGMTEKMESPGAVVFNKGGKEYRLDAILEAPDEKELFIMFADTTSARETYGAGRFIYIPLPVNGRAVVDFNKAYNPPCAFNDFATCPLPPPQNRLQLRVDAGEKKYVADRH